MMTRGFIGIAILLWLSARGFPQDSNHIGVFHVALSDPAPTILFGSPIHLPLTDIAKVPQSFHARVFPGKVAELLKRKPDRQNCVTFNTVILKAKVQGQLLLGAIKDPAWLSPARDDGFEAQDYVLVFESGDQPEDSLIRIHKTELPSYFKYAIPLRILPSEPLKKRVGHIVEAARKELRERNVEFERPTASLCWKVQLNVQEAELSSDTPKTREMERLVQCPCSAEDTSQARIGYIQPQTGSEESLSRARIINNDQ